MKPADRERLIGAAGVALIVAVVVWPLCLVAYRDDVADAEADTLIEARDRVDQALLAERTGDVTPPGNVWLVNLADEWSTPVGDVWTDPPLMSLAGPAADGGTVERAYEFDGQWLAYGEWIGANNVLLAVVERDGEASAIADARLRWIALGLLLPLAAGGTAWLALGRMQMPVRRAHDVNRDFIADAAHELRTPLSIIQASAGHALARDRSSDAYRQSLAEILDAAERAGASVGELLEFARLEAGQASLRSAPLRLDLLVEEVASSVRVDGSTVEAEPGEAVVVEADYNLMRQVVDNITRNAAARADKVVLTTHLDPRSARIVIADDGPGFDPGIIDHVFERFRRGDRSGSAGLGMAVARTIVELHGGSCEAANRAEGGAQVTVRLPYKPTT